MKEVLVDTPDRFKYHLYKGEERVKRSRTIEQLHLILLELWKKDRFETLEEFKNQYHVEIHPVCDKSKQRVIRYAK